MGVVLGFVGVVMGWLDGVVEFVGVAVRSFWCCRGTDE